MDADIETLHLICVERLKKLIQEANRTCGLLDKMTSFPISHEAWSEALAQRLAENEAHALYQVARENLFRALRPGSPLPAAP